MNESSIYTLISVSGSFIRVFPVLRDIIEESKSYDDPEKYIAFRSASVRSKWFHENYLSKRRTRGLKEAVSKSRHPKALLIYQLELNMIKSVTADKGIGGNKHFKTLEELLPQALVGIASEAPQHASSLHLLSRRIGQEVAETNVALVKLSGEDEKAAEEEPKCDLLKNQSLAVEAVINAVLSSLDKNKAHAVRLFIAKKTDKLAALQNALAT